MAASNRNIQFKAELLGARQFADAAKKDATAVKALGAETKVAGANAASSERGWGIFARSAHKSEEQAKRTHLSVHKLVGGLAGLGAGFEAFSAAKESVATTTELGESMMRLSKVQGFSNRAAAQWSAIAKVHGIQTAALSSSFGFLAKSMGTAATQQGTYARAVAMQQKAGHGVTAQLGAQAKAFEAMGISTRELRHGSMNTVLGDLSDRFAKMPGSALKTQLALQTLGRAGTKSLLPLMKDGATGLRGNLRDIRQLVLPFMPKNTKAVEAYAAAQQRAKYGMLGLQLAAGKYLLPAITKVVQAIGAIRKGIGAAVHWFGGLIASFRSGSGAAGKVATAFHAVQGVVMRYVVPAITAAAKAVFGFGQSTVRTFRQAIGPIKPVGTALLLVGKRALGLAKLIGGGVLHEVKAAWPAIKQTIGGAVKFIGGGIRVFTSLIHGDFHHAFSGLGSMVTGALSSMLGAIKTFTTPIRQVAGVIFGGFKSAMTDVVNFVIGKLNWIIRAFNNTAGRIPGVPNIGQIGKIAKQHKAQQAPNVFHQIAHTTKHVKFAAHGGAFRSGQTWISGERAPELNEMTGSRVKVTPLGKPRSTQADSTRRPAGASSGDLTVQLVLKDGHEIARAVVPHFRTDLLLRRQLGRAVMSYHLNAIADGN